MSLYSIFAFLCASMALTISPGPDKISIHSTAAALGISALFYSSAVAFNLVKFAGAFYLLYLAIKTVGRRSAFALGPKAELPASALFRRGFIMNVLNPKVALFFLAFLPQFVSPSSGHLPLQMLLLGALFMIQAVMIFSLFGWFSGTIGSYLLSKPHLSRYFDFLTAGIFVFLGARLALSER